MFVSRGGFTRGLVPEHASKFRRTSFGFPYDPPGVGARRLIVAPTATRVPERGRTARNPLPPKDRGGIYGASVRKPARTPRRIVDLES